MSHFNEVLDSYREILDANPGQALVIGEDAVAFLERGQLLTVELNERGMVDRDDAIDFSDTAWNTDQNCWYCDDSSAVTDGYIKKPELLELKFVKSH